MMPVSIKKKKISIAKSCYLKLVSEERGVLGTYGGFNRYGLANDFAQVPDLRVIALLMISWIHFSG